MPDESGVELATGYVSLVVSGTEIAPGVRRTLGAAEPEADKAGRRAGKRFSTGFGSNLKLLGAGAVGAGALSFLKDSVGLASDLNESTSKIQAIFGNGAKAVQAFSASGAEALGQTKLEILDAAATFGTFGKAAGLGGDDLAKFSTGFAGLSTDLASFFNTDPSDAVEAIGAALRGESEPIRKYGVLLDDATLRNEALRLGLIKTTKQALTPQQKVLAAQAAIYKQTKDAQGDFQRTSGGLANQQRILSARFADVKSEIGKGLLPILTKGATKTSEFIGQFQGGTGAGGDFRDVLEDVVSVGRGVVKFLDSIPGPIKKLGAETAIALLVVNKLGGIGGGGFPLGLSKARAFGAELRNTETRMDAVKRGAYTLGGQLTNVAGAGGLVAFQQGLRETNDVLGTTETTLGGFAAGFAIGGPIGAGIGTGIGLFVGLKNAISGTNDVRLPTTKELGLDDIVAGLNEANGAASELSKNNLFKFLRGEGTPPLGLTNGQTIQQTAAQFGIPDRQLVAAMSGDVKAFEAIKRRVNRLIREDRANGGVRFTATDREVILGSIRTLRTEARAQRQELLESAAATRDYGKALDGLPPAKRTKVEASGIIPTKQGIVDVAEAINATPDEVKVLVAASGVKVAVGEIQQIIDKLDELKRKNAVIAGAAVGAITGTLIQSSQPRVTVPRATVPSLPGTSIGPVSNGRQAPLFNIENVTTQDPASFLRYAEARQRAAALDGIPR